MDGRPSLPAPSNELWEYKVDELHEEEAGGQNDDAVVKRGSRHYYIFSVFGGL